VEEIMNFKRLEKNLIDNIKEAQLKLGFENRPMSLNYMSSSLKHLLEDEATDDVLQAFSKYAEAKLGKLSFGRIKNGVCITIPVEGTAYVNSLGGYEFLGELVEKVRNHASLEQVMAVFRHFSANVAVEEIDNGEFDLLAYFPDETPDEYYYCLTAEPCMNGGCHAMYHRFIREDYEEIFVNA
jgi:hypothetical protein